MNNPDIQIAMNNCTECGLATVKGSSLVTGGSRNFCYEVMVGRPHGK